jgi:DNA-binding transcriptional ArsR family regulator
MASTAWPLLAKVRSKLTQAGDFPKEIVPLLAARLEKAICATSQKSLKGLADDLSALLADIVRLSPQDALKAAHGEQKVDPSLAAAFILGEVSFAQLLASQAANRRASDEFLTLFRDTTSRRYINALSESELRNIDLARRLDISVEHISRTLKQLREEGIADFRRDGRDVYNFLTPAAQAVLAAEHRPMPGSANASIDKTQSHHDLQKSDYETVTSRKLQHALTQVDPLLRKQTTFARYGLKEEIR